MTMSETGVTSSVRTPSLRVSASATPTPRSSTAWPSTSIAVWSWSIRRTTPMARGRSSSRVARGKRDASRAAVGTLTISRTELADGVGQNARRRAAEPDLPELFGDDPVREDLPVERLRVDGQQRGGLPPVTADLAQRRDDVLALHRFEARPRRHGRSRGRAQHLRWQVVRLDLLALREDDRALDGVEQLADVAGPRVPLERGEGTGAEALGAVGRVRRDEVVGEERDVLGPLAEGRQLDRDRVDAEIEVLAERARLHRLGEIAVGRRHEPNVHPPRACGAHAKEGAGFQRTQELHLDVRLQLADFVEQERTAVGQLDEPRLRGDGAGERALLVAEELRLEHLAR